MSPRRRMRLLGDRGPNEPWKGKRCEVPIRLKNGTVRPCGARFDAFGTCKGGAAVTGGVRGERLRHSFEAGKVASFQPTVYLEAAPAAPSSALLEAIRALAEVIVEMEEQVLSPRQGEMVGYVELPVEVWERLVDLARRVPR